ncbi:hypothetical protein GCM10010862_14160 [Devosia nitrariae]|uniref:Uncharacterized protein n=1 Tax=Devosia nitrariae TaxID=2071872 RepID=A0ABQ5W2Q2_9HYPH|nr:hypothetical protein GCM10010862_14160 [Devosia nitrariae]
MDIVVLQAACWVGDSVTIDMDGVGRSGGRLQPARPKASLLFLKRDLLLTKLDRNMLGPRCPHAH